MITQHELHSMRLVMRVHGDDDEALWPAQELVLNHVSMEPDEEGNERPYARFYSVVFKLRDGDPRIGTVVRAEGRQIIDANSGRVIHTKDYISLRVVVKQNTAFAGPSIQLKS